MVAKRTPRVLVAGLRGGGGKTLVTLGLIGSWRRQGLSVAPFKKGPDYIDAAWAAVAAAQPCHNLDAFLMTREAIVASLLRHSEGADIAVIEGNRGLYDGVDAEGTCSSAELAKLLGCPVILVVDCTKCTRTVAAEILGCQSLDPAVNIAGVVLNRVTSGRQEAVIRQAIGTHCGIPVLGALHKLGNNTLAERHLGLIPCFEHEAATFAVERLADMVESSVDVSAIQRLAEACGALASSYTWERQCPVTTLSGPPVIGVFRDAAFNFYYPENLEALSRQGARIVTIDALTETQLPPVDGLYIGGGFPETHARALADNVSLRSALRARISDGLVVLAECGGLIYLSESLTVGNTEYPMVGVFPVAFGMASRPQGHGYTCAEVDRPNPIFDVGTVLKGHEFRYAQVLKMREESIRTAFQLRRGCGFSGRRDGLFRDNAFGSFTHFHALGTPDWAPSFVRRVRLERALSAPSVRPGGGLPVGPQAPAGGNPGAFGPRVAEQMGEAGSSRLAEGPAGRWRVMAEDGT